MRAVLHRALITGIILFWLVMTGLLLRVELFPNRGDLLEIPIAHVVKLIFFHQQPSDLVLFHQHQRLGDIHLQPQRMKDPADPEHYLETLEATGAVALRLPGFPYGRATFRSVVELNEAHEIQHFDGTITLHVPKQTEPNPALQFDGRPPLDQYHYAMRRGETVVKEAAGSIAKLLADPDLAVLGVDPEALLVQAQKSAQMSGGAGKLVCTAHRGDLQLSGESLETFVVDARYADSLDSTIHVSQLGQILAVKTFLDYNLYDTSLAP